MADTGKQSPLGVNALSSILQNKGLFINPKVPRFIGISRTNDEYIWTWWRDNNPSGLFPADPLESTSTEPGTNNTGKIIEDTVLRLLTWSINEGWTRKKFSDYNSLIYIGSDINASITINNSGWPEGSTLPSNQPTTVLNRGICTIPALGNAKPPTYQPYDPARRWNGTQYNGLSPAPANTGWPMSGNSGQTQGASWFPYSSGGANPGITQWGYFRLHYLQAWNEFKYNDPQVTSPYNYLPPYNTASYPPKYKDFCASFVSADAWKNYSNQAIYSMYNSQEFLKGAYSGINDLISGDLAGINTAFTWFGEDLRLLGKAFNVKKIDKFGYPSTLLATIIENNAMTQELSLALDAVEIFTSDIDGFMSGSVIPSVEQERKIYSAFLTIRGQNLEPILRVLNCTTFTYNNGTNQVVENDAYLSDLLSPAKMFRWSKDSLFIPIYNNSTQNIQEAGSKLRIRLFPNGNSVNSELTSAAVTENVGQLITDGSPPIITADISTSPLIEPQKGFNSKLQSIIPNDDAIACTALSYAFSQVTNIQQSDNENFAQAVKRLEAIPLNLLTQVNGTNNYTPVNVPIAQKGHFITSSGSGPRGTFTMSDMFGSMSSLPYPWETIYRKIRQIAWNPGVGNSIQTDQSNAGLFYIYKQLFLALTWEPAIFWIYQFPIDLRKGCNTPYVAGACLNLYQPPEPYSVAEIGSKGLVGKYMEITEVTGTSQWTWNYIAGNPEVTEPCPPPPPDVSPETAALTALVVPDPPPPPKLDTYKKGDRITIVRDPGTAACVGSGVVNKLFKDPYPYQGQELVIEYPWRGYVFYDPAICCPVRLDYDFERELFCDRSIKGFADGYSIWLSTTEYPGGFVVAYQGKLYRAKTTVPPGTPPTNTTYWSYEGEQDDPTMMENGAQRTITRDQIFPARGLENGGGYLRGRPDAGAPSEEAASFGGPRPRVFPEYRNVSGLQAYVKKMGNFDTTAQSDRYGRFGRIVKWAQSGGRVWYFRKTNITYPDGRTFPSSRYWKGNDGPTGEGIYSSASPVGAGYGSSAPPFTEIWWDVIKDPDWLWGQCNCANPAAQIPPWRLFITTPKPPPDILPVFIKEDGAPVTRTSLDGQNVDGDIYTWAGSRSGCGANALVETRNNAWEDGRIPAAIRAYIAQANKEIRRIYNARNVNDPNDPVNQLNTLYEYCGTQLMIEQRTRYYALPPVPIPYDDFLNAWPTPLYTFVDSLPMLHQDTAPHMTSQTLDEISDWQGGSDTLNPVYDTTRHGMLGGQSTIAMGPQERNQQKLAVVGIPLSNNIENYIQPEERMVWTMNNTINQATNNQSTPGGDFIITAWPGYIQPGGDQIAPIPQGRFIERPVPSITVIPGQASGTGGTPGPWPQVGTLVTGPGPGPGLTIFDNSVITTENTTIGTGGNRPIVNNNETGTRVIVDRFDPEIDYERDPISSRKPPKTITNATQPNSINFPVRVPNFANGGTPPGGLGTDGQGTLLTGVGYNSIIPVNLDPLFTGTTTFQSTLSIDQAIAQVIACNCDCFIN